uniref:Uncharacterized protein n=1 Tax=Pararge aegeria TaxID=116150 RepID=S4P144_9NEOP
MPFSLYLMRQMGRIRVCQELIEVFLVILILVPWTLIQELPTFSAKMASINWRQKQSESILYSGNNRVQRCLHIFNRTNSLGSNEFVK